MGRALLVNFLKARVLSPSELNAINISTSGMDVPDSGYWLVCFRFHHQSRVSPETYTKHWENSVTSCRLKKTTNDVKSLTSEILLIKIIVSTSYNMKLI